MGKIYDKADTCQMITTANIQGIMEISGKEGATPLYSIIGPEDGRDPIRMFNIQASNQDDCNMNPNATISSHCSIELILKHLRIVGNRAPEISTSLFKGGLINIGWIQSKASNDGISNQYMVGPHLAATHVEFVGCTDVCAYEGGIMFLNSYATVDLNHTSFTGGQARGRGGAIVATNRAIVNVANTVFDSNSAKDGGGAVYLKEILLAYFNTYKHAFSWPAAKNGDKNKHETLTPEATMNVFSGVIFKNNQQYLPSGDDGGGAILVEYGRRFGARLNLIGGDTIFEGNSAKATKNCGTVSCGNSLRALSGTLANVGSGTYVGKDNQPVIDFQRCEPGTWSSWSISNPVIILNADFEGCTNECDAGTYARGFENRHVTCTDECKNGFYCPRRTGEPISCGGDAFTTAETGAESQSDCIQNRCLAGTVPIGNGMCKICTIGLYQPDALEFNATNKKCVKCPSARFVLDDGKVASEHVSCKYCPKGYEFDSSVTNCLICPGGRYQDEDDATTLDRLWPRQIQSDGKNQSSCKACPPNEFLQDNRKDVLKHLNLGSCDTCQDGTFSLMGDRFCQQCPPGKRTFIFSMMGDSHTTCRDCAKGRYSDTQASKECTACPIGYATDKIDSLFCLPCIPGSYADLKEQESCKNCDANTFTDQTGQSTCKDCSTGEKSVAGSAKCIKCDAGAAGTGINGTCQTCVKGQYRTSAMNATSCMDCLPGQYQDQVGQANCLLCLPGRSQPSKSMSKCGPCEKGKLQKNPGASSCEFVPSGKIVGSGGSTSVTVPLGSKICDNMEKPDCDCVANGDCVPFQACPIGTFGENPPTNNCRNCKAGTTSYRSSIHCSPCDKGTYNPYEGNKCLKCPTGQFQDQSKEASLTCRNCPIGFSQENEGESFCFDEGGLKPADCNDAHYFNVTGKSCISCPNGASCVGPITSKHVIAMFGWSRCPAPNILRFAECKRPASCLGAPNDQLQKDFKEIALVPRNESCAIGHVQNISLNLRCSRCAPGYAAPSGSFLGTCVSCKDQSGTIIFVVLAAFLAIIVFFVLITLKMKSSGTAKAEHSTMKRTLLTHLQMLSIVMSLSVPWPTAVRTLLAFVTSLTSVSSHTSTVTCTSADTNLSPAEVYYGMLVFSAVLPFAVMAITFLYWQVCAPRSKLLSCGSSLINVSICPNNNPFLKIRLGSHVTVNAKGKVQRSTRDGWIVTNVLLLYILIPSIVKAGLQMCQWETICGVKYWVLDDTVEYYSAAHQSFIIAVAVPSILFYGVVLIMLAMIYIGLHKNRQSNKKLMFRFGLLFSGFAPHFWWYEIILFFRKLGVIFIVTFASSNEQQLHIAMGLLVVLLYLQEHVRPFDNPEASDSAQVQSDRLHRMESSSLLVLITMVWCAVFFVLGCDDQSGLCSGLGVSVLLINVVFVSVVGFYFAQAFGKKNHFSEKLTALTHAFSSSRGMKIEQSTESAVHVVNPTLFSTGESKIKCNPLSVEKNKAAFAKERRRNREIMKSSIDESRNVEMTAITESIVLNEIEIKVEEG